MKRRIAARVAAATVALATVAGLSACAPSGAASDGDKVTLSFWSWRAEDTEAWSKIIDAFESSHPNINVEYNPYTATEYDTILKTGLSAAGGPDVAMIRTNGGLLPVANQLLDLTNLVDLTEFPDSAVGSVSGTDGALLGIPINYISLGVYYNRGLFEQVGVGVPGTWGEFIDACEKLKAAGITPIATTGKDTWMLPLVHDILTASEYGGADFANDVLSGKAGFTDLDYVASLDTLASLGKYFPDNVTAVAYTDAQALFTNGVAAMYPGGSFERVYFQTLSPDLDFGVFAAPPVSGSGDGLYAGYADSGVGVSKESAHPEEALEFVNWLTTSEFGQLASDELGILTWVPGITPKDDVLAKMNDGYLASLTPSIMLDYFRGGTPDGFSLLGEEIQKILLGLEDGSSAAANIQSGISEWFKPSS